MWTAHQLFAEWFKLLYLIVIQIQILFFPCTLIQNVIGCLFKGELSGFKNIPIAF